MTPDQIVRAWKDADFNSSLTPDEAASVPPIPVGAMDLADDAIDLAAGGMVAGTQYLETIGCCKGFTQAGKCDFTIGYPYCTCQCITIFWTGDSICG